MYLIWPLVQGRIDFIMIISVWSILPHILIESPIDDAVMSV